MPFKILSAWSINSWSSWALSHAPLVGHSMGGTVSLSVAIRYPERVSKVVVVGSPIIGSSLAIPLKLAGYKPIAFMLFNMMGVFRFGVRVASPFICRDERFAEMMDRDLSRTTVESFLLSIASLRRTDLRPMLDQIKVPALGIYGDRDIIVNPRQWRPMQQGIAHAQVERFPLLGHFPMLEEPRVCLPRNSKRSSIKTTPQSRGRPPPGLPHKKHPHR
jgi:pimeloyl-ACP methyl ester carboxylesterase